MKKLIEKIKNFILSLKKPARQTEVPVIKGPVSQNDQETRI